MRFPADSELQYSSIGRNTGLKRHWYPVFDWLSVSVGETIEKLLQYFFKLRRLRSCWRHFAIALNPKKNRFLFGEEGKKSRRVADRWFYLLLVSRVQYCTSVHHTGWTTEADPTSRAMKKPLHFHFFSITPRYKRTDSFYRESPEKEPQFFYYFENLTPPHSRSQRSSFSHF